DAAGGWDRVGGAGAHVRERPGAGYARGARAAAAISNVARRFIMNQKGRGRPPGVSVDQFHILLLHSRRPEMRNGLVCAVVATALVLLCAGTAGAQLIYSFENGTATNPDGFGPNGGGVTIAQDTIGATESTHSMKVSVV